jgi:peptidoglycan/LPS O-acetylase OafA/YrhL
LNNSQVTDPVTGVQDPVDRDSLLPLTARSRSEVRMDRRAHERFPCIDGLRALAAVSVVFCHTAGVSTIISTAAGPYLAELRSGVQIFFVISGFVLYRPFARAHLDQRAPPQVRAYLRRRFFRIYPAYWLVLTIGVYVLHVMFLFGQRAVVVNYALVQSYFHEFYLDGLGPAWTLVVEMSFYISLPVIASVIRRMVPRRPFAAEIAGLAVLFWIGILCTAWSAFGNPPLFVQVLPMNLSPFALGMLLAVLSVVFQQRELPSWLSFSASRPWASWLVALIAWTSIVWAVHYPTALSFVARVPGWKVLAYTFLLDVIGLSMVFPAVFGDQGQGVIRHVLQMRFIVFVGLVSYGVYLWHDPIISELSKYVDRANFLSAEPYVNWLAITATVLAASVLVAMVSWFAVERPLIAVSRRPTRVRGRRHADDQVSPIDIGTASESTIPNIGRGNN